MQTPNILPITSDQHRADCYGFENPHLNTPHPDSLARAGTRFSACITTNLVCQPSRASILTGQLPLTHGVWDSDEAFFRAAGIKLTNIPCRGGDQAVGDVASGQVKIGILGLAPLVPHLASGCIVALAVTSKERSPLLPAVPSLAEACLPGTDIVQRFGVLGPAGLPADMVERLNGEIRKVLADPEIRKRLALAALTPVAGTLMEFASRIREEGSIWARMARESGLGVD